MKDSHLWIVVLVTMLIAAVIIVVRAFIDFPLLVAILVFTVTAIFFKWFIPEWYFIYIMMR